MFYKKQVMQHQISPKEKVWFITGASKGFGLSLVKLALAGGHKVAATSRHAADLEKQITDHRENLLALTMDLTSDDSVKNAITKTVETFGRLDVVVNNAGYMILGSLEEMTAAEFQESMSVNVFGTVNVIRAAMPYLRKQRSGHVFNFSSVAGYSGHGNAGGYNSVKFAVIGLSEALAQEAKPFGINVTVVAPGLFRTSFLNTGSFTIAKNTIEGYGSDNLVKAMQQTNGKQPGDPDKLVAALIKLTDEKNPPVHLLMGPDAYHMAMEARKAEHEEFEAWKHITLSTDL